MKCVQGKQARKVRKINEKKNEDRRKERGSEEKRNDLKKRKKKSHTQHFSSFNDSYACLCSNKIVMFTLAI